MSQRTPALTLTKTPIERIFEKVICREMTANEREVLHLNGVTRRVVVKPGNGNGNGVTPRTRTKLVA
jgi:hypothetical protein